MMIIDGAKLLEMKPIYKMSDIDCFVIVCILLSAFLIIVFVVVDKFKLSIILSFIFAVGLIIYEGKNGNKEISRYEYKIEIQDYSKINMAEFSDKYEIIEIDGNVWTIEEKEKKDD